MAMLGSFRTGSLKELEKATSTSSPTYMQASLPVQAWLHGTCP